MWQYYLLIILGGFLASSVGAMLYQVPVRQALLCGFIGGAGKCSEIDSRGSLP